MLFQVYIKSNLQRNVTDHIFVMTCGEADKACFSLLNVFQEETLWVFSRNIVSVRQL